jgi:hypothetical protein
MMVGLHLLNPRPLGGEGARERWRVRGLFGPAGS